MPRSREFDDENIVPLRSRVRPEGHLSVSYQRTEQLSSMGAFQAPKCCWLFSNLVSSLPILRKFAAGAREQPQVQGTGNLVPQCVLDSGSQVWVES